MADDQEQKPKLEGDDQQITIKIKDQENGVVEFRVKQTTKWSKIMDAYCKKKGISDQSVRFLFDGQRIVGHTTPVELGMEDGDSVDVMQYQVGGC